MCFSWTSLPSSRLTSFLSLSLSLSLSLTQYFSFLFSPSIIVACFVTAEVNVTVSTSEGRESVPIWTGVIDYRGTVRVIDTWNFFALFAVSTSTTVGVLIIHLLLAGVRVCGIKERNPGREQEEIAGRAVQELIKYFLYPWLFFFLLLLLSFLFFFVFFPFPRLPDLEFGVQRADTPI